MTVQNDPVWQNNKIRKLETVCSKKEFQVGNHFKNRYGVEILQYAFYDTL